MKRHTHIYLHRKILEGQDCSLFVFSPIFFLFFCLDQNSELIDSPLTCSGSRAWIPVNPRKATAKRSGKEYPGVIPEIPLV